MIHLGIKLFGQQQLHRARLIPYCRSIRVSKVHSATRIRGQRSNVARFAQGQFTDITDRNKDDALWCHFISSERRLGSWRSKRWRRPRNETLGLSNSFRWLPVRRSRLPCSRRIGSTLHRSSETRVSFGFCASAGIVSVHPAGDRRRDGPAGSAGRRLAVWTIVARRFRPPRSHPQQRVQAAFLAATTTFAVGGRGITFRSGEFPSSHRC